MLEPFENILSYQITKDFDLSLLIENSLKFEKTSNRKCFIPLEKHLLQVSLGATGAQPDFGWWDDLVYSVLYSGMLE